MNLDLFRNCLEQGLRVRGSGVDSSVNEHAEDERNAVIGNFGTSLLITLDLTGVACPINFVRTKLKLETMSLGEELQVILDDGEPIESVSKSILEEGQEIVSKTRSGDHWQLLIRKIKQSL